ncbi:AAC(3) family N-acetyltransferase [Halobacteria archaeon AArc-curdl1]|uniref:AAC(3) family N-acetyltransferase n=1 Tax=Natronosalvus hydrolyticus TaxID=2979988 RepID=A0AAP2Z6U5_9EURY|nr:AAC(3) family N-acetyltransferase [Halobacteria archaeon AArc-curdl1]
MTDDDTVPAKSTVTGDDLVRDLRALGFQTGDEFVVHSSLSSLGWVDGGADTVVDALRAVVGNEGTVVVPTFTPFIVREEPFDREGTPSKTGAVTEALRTRPNSIRSDHPTHSVAALGPAARELTAGHELDRSLGRDSPLHRLAQRGGKVLLLGIGHERNSTLHVAEVLAKLPYKTGTNEVLVQSGDVRTVHAAKVGCGKGFPALEPVADEAGILTRGRIGHARAQTGEGAALLEVALEVLDSDPGFLLCENPDCWWCPEAREALSSA